MNQPIENPLPPVEICRPYLVKLEGIFEEMDRAYQAVASVYGFECRGCSDSCCLTRFYHHTLLEFMVLFEGFGSLAAEDRDTIARQAGEVR